MREAHQNHFLPNLTALDLTFDEKILMCKPVRHVGPIAFERSQQSTLLLTKATKPGQGFNLTDYESDIPVNKNHARISKGIQTLQEI